MISLILTNEQISIRFCSIKVPTKIVGVVAAVIVENHQVSFCVYHPCFTLNLLTGYHLDFSSLRRTTRSSQLSITRSQLGSSSLSIRIDLVTASNVYLLKTDGLMEMTECLWSGVIPFGLFVNVNKPENPNLESKLYL